VNNLSHGHPNLVILTLPANCTCERRAPKAFPDHCLAHMKQRLSMRRYACIFLFAAIGFIACARMPRHHSPGEISSQFTNSNKETQGLSVININTASVEELEQLAGIGPALAARIVTYRQEHGHFRRAEHLLMVRGISERKFHEIRSRITVN
jgi:competence ComEA-like helix-hairpin-helix protein